MKASVFGDMAIVVMGPVWPCSPWERRGLLAFSPVGPCAPVILPHLEVPQVLIPPQVVVPQREVLGTGCRLQATRDAHLACTSCYWSCYLLHASTAALPCV